MRLSCFRVDKGGAEARAWRFMQPARGFDVAIRDGGQLAGRFRCGDDFLGLTALAALFGIARRHW